MKNNTSIDIIIKNFERELSQKPPNEKVSERLDKVREIATKYEGEDKIVSFQDIAKRIKESPPEVQIMTGWTKLDEIIKGFRLQQLVVVSGLTKNGKSAWMMDLTTRIKDFNPLWFPFEESAEELVNKFLERNETPPHGYTPSVTRENALPWLETRIVESIIKWGTKVVVIDQLDFIVSYTSSNRADAIGYAMQELKKLANKWHICIFLICHLQKTKMDTEPTLEDLRGSSAIGQTADTVILIWRESRRENKKMITTNNTNISVQANRRHGKTGNVEMVFKDGHYEEFAWSSSAQADEELDNF